MFQARPTPGSPALQTTVPRGLSPAKPSAAPRAVCRRPRYAAWFACLLVCTWLHGACKAPRAGLGAGDTLASCDPDLTDAQPTASSTDPSSTAGDCQVQAPDADTGGADTAGAETAGAETGGADTADTGGAESGGSDNPSSGGMEAEPGECLDTTGETANPLATGSPCTLPMDAYGCALQGRWTCQAGSDLGTCAPEATAAPPTEPAPGSPCGPPDNSACHLACPDGGADLVCVDSNNTRVGDDFSQERCGNGRDDDCDGLTDRARPPATTEPALALDSCCAGNGPNCQGDCTLASPQTCCTAADCQSPCVEYSRNGNTVQVVACQCRTEDSSSPTTAEQGGCYPKCGNGLLDATEACDPSVPGTDPRLCSPRCTAQALLLPCTDAQLVGRDTAIDEVRAPCDAVQLEAGVPEADLLPQLCVGFLNGLSARNYCLPMIRTADSRCPAIAADWNLTPTELSERLAVCGLDCDTLGEDDSPCGAEERCLDHFLYDRLGACTAN